MSIPVSPEAVALHALLSQSGGRDSVRVPSAELLKLLYRQMRVLAGPRPDLDDLVQCAAERVIRALPRFEGRSSLSTFAYGVAYRTLLGHDRWFRRWQRRFSSSAISRQRKTLARLSSSPFRYTAENHDFADGEALNRFS